MHCAFFRKLVNADAVAYGAHARNEDAFSVSPAAHDFNASTKQFLH
jgi:hypothetical protein